MFKFFSNAKQELEHVVWPTPNETKKYMYYTVGVIVIMTLLLSTAGYGLQTSLSSLRQAIGAGQVIETTTSGEENVTQKELQDLVKTLSGRTSASGAVSGEVK